MLDMQEVRNTIEELEAGDTNFNNCQKLAILYTVRNNYNAGGYVDKVESELSDILPQYRNYCKVKRAFQLQQVTSDKVIFSMHNVCKEIREFIQTLYSNTDIPEEREELKTMVQGLEGVF